MTTATEPARRGRPGYARESTLEVVVAAFNERATSKALDALEAMFDAPEAMTGPVVSRIRYIVRGAVLVLCEHRPFVTPLLGLRGNTPIELEATLRRDMDPRIAERLTFSMVNSIVEWYRPVGPITPERSPTRCSSSRGRACASRLRCEHFATAHVPRPGHCSRIDRTSVRSHTSDSVDPPHGTLTPTRRS